MSVLPCHVLFYPGVLLPLPSHIPPHSYPSETKANAVTNHKNALLRGTEPEYLAKHAAAKEAWTENIMPEYKKVVDDLEAIAFNQQRALVSIHELFVSWLLVPPS